MTKRLEKKKTLKNYTMQTSDWPSNFKWQGLYLDGCFHQFQFSSVTHSCPTLFDPMDCSIPGLPVHHQLPEFTQTQVHRVNDTIQPSHPLSSPSPPAFNFSLFSKESVLHIRWPKYWSFSFSISPSNEYSELISFRTDWLDLLVVQGTLKSLLQYHSSKASILQYSAFFMVQLSHPYMTPGKTIALTRWTFVGKVMSLLFNMLSRLVIAFLPRSKCLLILCSHHLQWFWSSPLKLINFIFTSYNLYFIKIYWKICSDFGAPSNINSSIYSLIISYIQQAFLRKLTTLQKVLS